MRHLVDGRKLGRPTGHRMSMLRNLAMSFFEKERIRTTVQRAKELRSVAERLITLAKRGELHHRRQVIKVVPRRSTVKKLFDQIAPRFTARKGGYTRIIRVGPRKGDGAEMAYLELIGSEFKPKVKEKGKGKAAKKEAGKKDESRPTPDRKAKDRSAEKVDVHGKSKQQVQHVKAPGE